MKPIELILLFLLLTVGCSTTQVPTDLKSISTAQLQLKHSQLDAELGNAKFEYDKSTDSSAQMGIGMRIRNITAKKNGVEQELLRRYEAGEKSAYLRGFGPQK
jgi:hypothetical protein